MQLDYVSLYWIKVKNNIITTKNGIKNKSIGSFSSHESIATKSANNSIIAVITYEFIIVDTTLKRFYICKLINIVNASNSIESALFFEVDS